MILGFFLYLLLFLYLVIGVLMVRWLHRSLNSELAYFYSIDPDNMPEKYKPFARFDRNKWKHFEIYFCGMFLFSIRIFLMIIFTISYYIVIKICSKIWKSTSQQTRLQRFIIKLGGNLLARGILFCAGFYYIPHKKALISNYLPDYPIKASKNIKAPIIISNHYSWIDIYYFIASKFCPSYLSKKEVIHYPFIGVIAQGLQTVFVSRESQNDRNSVLMDLIERSEKIIDGENYPQILIFPEGTTTNGHYLISFKKGAFLKNYPIQIICLKYEERNFSLSYDGIGDIYCLVLPFCHFINKFSVIEFDVFDPSYLKIDENSENGWVIYMQKVKEVMLKCLGAKNSEAGFIEKKEYYAQIRNEIKKKLGSKKFDEKKID